MNVPCATYLYQCAEEMSVCVFGANQERSENQGLISADRGTRPLSCLQYPVLI